MILKRFTKIADKLKYSRTEVGAKVGQPAPTMPTGYALPELH